MASSLEATVENGIEICFTAAHEGMSEATSIQRPDDDFVIILRFDGVTVRMDRTIATEELRSRMHVVVDDLVNRVVAERNRLRQLEAKS